jgi:hypothetical protein
MPLQKKTVLEGERLVAAIAFLGQQNPPVKFVGDGAGGGGDGAGDDMRRGLRVNVSAAKLGDEGFEALCSAIGSNRWVQKLNASRCGFGPRGATHLGDALRSNGSLRELWLENNQIGNQGAEHIIESALPENRGRVDEHALKVSKGIDYVNQVREENERQEAIEDPGLEGSSRRNSEAVEASATDGGDRKVKGGVVVVGTPSSRRRSSIVSLAGSVTLAHGAFLNEPQILTVLNLKACGIGPQWPTQILQVTTRPWTAARQGFGSVTTPIPRLGVAGPMFHLSWPCFPPKGGDFCAKRRWRFPWVSVHDSIFLPTIPTLRL